MANTFIMTIISLVILGGLIYLFVLICKALKKYIGDKKGRLSYIKGGVYMKKIIVFIMALVCICGLSGCNAPDSPTEVETVSTDYGKVIDLAKAEFKEVFKEFKNLKIEETATMTRTDDAKEIVVQITYSSSNGNGIYGLMYNLDDYSNPELMQQGEDITIDNILE